MSIRSTFFTTAFLLATLGTAHAESLRPIQAKSVDLGDVSGVAYYTIERDGFHVVTTLAQGEAGTPIRVALRANDHETSESEEFSLGA
jgi:hypothetical protein